MPAAKVLTIVAVIKHCLAKRAEDADSKASLVSVLFEVED